MAAVACSPAARQQKHTHTRSRPAKDRDTPRFAQQRSRYFSAALVTSCYRVFSPTAPVGSVVSVEGVCVCEGSARADSLFRSFGSSDMQGVRTMFLICGPRTPRPWGGRGGLRFYCHLCGWRVLRALKLWRQGGLAAYLQKILVGRWYGTYIPLLVLCLSPVVQLFAETRAGPTAYFLEGLVESRESGCSNRGSAIIWFCFRFVSETCGRGVVCASPLACSVYQWT